MTENRKSSESAPKTALDRINRRQVMKSIGGVGAVGLMGLFSAPAQASTSTERVTGAELEALVRTVAKSDDVSNVGPAAMRETVRQGRLVEVSHGEGRRTVATRGSPRSTRANGLDGLADGDVLVAAARHTLENGNRMTAVAFVAGTGEAVWFRRYEKPEARIETIARAWEIDGGETLDDAALVAGESSANGEVTRPQSDFTANSCSGCEPGPAPGGYREQEECTNVDLACATWGCGGCALCGPNIICLVACLGIHCPGTLAFCCTNWETNCALCGGMA